MRREGCEFQVSKPEAIVKVIDGHKLEPYELLVVDVAEEAIGSLTENLSLRLARMTDMRSDGQGHVCLKFKVPTRGLIGFRSFFLKVTRGNGALSSIFTSFEPLRGDLRPTRTGALVAAETGVAVTYGLNNAQQRGLTFIEAGTPIYEGMIVGAYTRDNDRIVNVCKEKKLTNMRASTADIAIKLSPPAHMSLEESLDFIADDEVIDVTPKNIRLRKRILSNSERHRMGRGKIHALAER